MELVCGVSISLTIIEPRQFVHVKELKIYNVFLDGQYSDS